jgi:uncharacterized membrane protein YbhN (UPF0104 family)
MPWTVKRPTSSRLRKALPLVIGLATIGGFAITVHRTGASLGAATSPKWLPLAGSFAISALIQPLRALAWRSAMVGSAAQHAGDPASAAMRGRLCFRSVFAASALGSFLDTILPGRLGEASKVAVLRVASGGGTRWPGAARAGGALVTSLLLEAVAFALVGAVAAPFLPIPGWAKMAIVGSSLLAVAGIAALVALDRLLGRRLPKVLAGFVAGAAAPVPTLVRAGLIMLSTWLARWFAILFVLHAYGLKVGLGGALLYMVVTGLANVAPLLPGNAGIYQGAAVGVLGVLGHAGSGAIAVSLATPIVGSLATALAAVVALALFGRRFREISRAALRRPAAAVAAAAA